MLLIHFQIQELLIFSFGVRDHLNRGRLRLVHRYFKRLFFSGRASHMVKTWATHLVIIRVQVPYNWSVRFLFWTVVQLVANTMLSSVLVMKLTCYRFIVLSCFVVFSSIGGKMISRCLLWLDAHVDLLLTSTCFLNCTIVHVMRCSCILDCPLA